MPNSPQNPWKKLSSQIVYQNKWYSVRRDEVIRPDGQPGEYNVVESPEAVFIVPVDEDQNVYLIGLFRYTTNMYSLEIPAGGGEGQDPLVAAKRELQEEIGHTAGKWEKLGNVQSANGLLCEIGHVYLATELSDTGQHAQLEEGINEVRKVPLREAFQMIKRGEISDAQTISALTLTALHLGLLK